MHTYILSICIYVCMYVCKRKHKYPRHRWSHLIHNHLRLSGKMIISTLCIINNDKASFMERRRRRCLFARRRLLRVLQRSPRRHVAINFNLSLCCRLKSTRRLGQLSANRRRLSGREEAQQMFGRRHGASVCF